MKVESESVARVVDPVSSVSKKQVAVIKNLAFKSKLRRSRICFHEDNNAFLQEMHICVNPDSYIRPAKHLTKVESLLVLQGLAKLFLFCDEGYIEKIIDLGPYGTDRTHYYRLNVPIFHTLLIETETFLFHEVTEGPFDQDQTEPASWSPSGIQVGENLKFIEFLKTGIVGTKFEQ